MFGRSARAQRRRLVSGLVKMTTLLLYMGKDDQPRLHIASRKDRRVHPPRPPSLFFEALARVLLSVKQSVMLRLMDIRKNLGPVAPEV
jgi:hypothetical protein